MTRLAAILLCAVPLSACAPPDRWNAGYAHEPAAGTSRARDLYSVGVSGPLPSGARHPVDPSPLER